MSDVPLAPDVRGYAAAFVTDRLLANKTLRSRADAEQLWKELMRFLWLNEVDRARAWPLCSELVAEAWQQFLLFSYEYERFCRRYFGRFLHPRPVSHAHDARRAFAARYRELYGRELPSVWYDERFVDDERRLVREAHGLLRVDAHQVALCDAAQVRLRRPRTAEPALRFICDHASFYVRELPLPDSGARGALCRALVRTGFLCLAR